MTRTALLAGLALLVSACATVGGPGRELVVTATAYNSLPHQTDRHPELAAWGDRLEPGMRAVAVSPDLIALGLERGATVRIEGLDGEFTVLDKIGRVIIVALAGPPPPDLVEKIEKGAGSLAYFYLSTVSQIEANISKFHMSGSTESAAK